MKPALLLILSVLMVGCEPTQTATEAESVQWRGSPWPALNRIKDAWGDAKERYAHHPSSTGYGMYDEADFSPIKWTRTLTLEPGEAFELPVGLTDLRVECPYAPPEQVYYAHPVAWVDGVGGGLYDGYFVTNGLAYEARGVRIKRTGISLRVLRYEGDKSGGDDSPAKLSYRVKP